MKLSLRLRNVYLWGGGVETTVLPRPTSLLGGGEDAEVLQVALSRTQKAAVTKSGKLLLWEAHEAHDTPKSSQAPATIASVQASHEPLTPAHTFLPRVLDGQAAVSIVQVSCGDMFLACITDRGILMTFGSGSNGCLGHGKHSDVAQAKIVADLVGKAVVQISCGTSHVLALTDQGELYAWGRGDNGRLGLGTKESHSRPQLVPLTPTVRPRRLLASLDCSAIVAEDGGLYVCGRNRDNKLGLNEIVLTDVIVDGGDTTTTTGGDATTTTGVQDSEGSSSNARVIRVKSANAFGESASAPLRHSEVFELVTECWEFNRARTLALRELNVARVAIGNCHSALITANNELYTWGSNASLQLGHSGSHSVPYPRRVEGLTVADRVGCGDSFTVAATKDGSVYSWGKAARNRLGRPEGALTPAPVALAGVARPGVVVDLVCSQLQTMLICRAELTDAASTHS